MAITSFIPKGYATKADVENYLLIDIDHSFDNQVDSWIAAAEEYIESYTGRVFIAASGQVAKYDGNGGSKLFIDDFLEIESVAIDGRTLSENAYHLYPANRTPKTWIELDMQRMPTVFTRGQQNVVVSGVGGFSAQVPPAISHATAVLVASVIEMGRSGGVAVQESLGNYSVTFKKTVDNDAFLREILDQHRKPYIRDVWGGGR